MTTRRTVLLASCALAAGCLLSGPARADDTTELQTRARSFWDARVAGDWDTVYSMLPPEEQAQVTREKYVEYQATGGPFRYLKAQIGEITIDKDMAWIALVYTVEARQYPGIPPREITTFDIWTRREDWRPVPRAILNEYPRRPPHARPAEEEARLIARVDASWQARQKQDWTAVYGFLEPGYRQNVSLEEFLLRRAKLIYESHQVVWAEVTEDRARAKVVFTHRLNDPSVSKMTPRESTDVEDWIKIDGEWYRDLTAKNSMGSD
jgi:hypothetical protein